MKSLKSNGTDSLENFTKRREDWVFRLLRREKDARHRADETPPFSSEQSCSKDFTCPGYKVGFNILRSLHQGQFIWTAYAYLTKPRVKFCPVRFIIIYTLPTLDILGLFSYKLYNFKVNHHQNLFITKTTVNQNEHYHLGVLINCIYLFHFVNTCFWESGQIPQGTWWITLTQAFHYKTLPCFKFLHIEHYMLFLLHS